MVKFITSFKKCTLNFLNYSNKYLRFFSDSQTNIIRRSVFYVPAGDLSKLSKIDVFKKCDSVILDLEDSIDLKNKETARSNAIEFFKNVPNIQDTEFGIRINSRRTEYAEIDIDQVFSQTQPSVLMYPKVETIDDIKWLESKIKIAQAKYGQNYTVPLILMTESAIGLLNLRSILDYCTDNKCLLSITSVLFGSDDFLASIGATRTEDHESLQYARQHIVIHAKAFGLGAIDMVNTNFTDLIKLKRESKEGHKLGFTGKQVIHPKQVAIVNAAFSPSDDEIQWATNVMEAYEKHRLNFEGVFIIDGKMIDRPLIEQATNILKYLKKIKK